MSRVGNFPVIRYFREAREELNKVTWPTQKEVLTYSAFVIGLSFALGAYFGLIDWLLTMALEKLVNLVS